ELWDHISKKLNTSFIKLDIMKFHKDLRPAPPAPIVIGGVRCSNLPTTVGMSYGTIFQKKLNTSFIKLDIMKFHKDLRPAPPAPIAIGVVRCSNLPTTVGMSYGTIFQMVGKFSNKIISDSNSEKLLGNDPIGIGLDEVVPIPPLIRLEFILPSVIKAYRCR